MLDGAASSLSAVSFSKYRLVDGVDFSFGFKVVLWIERNTRFETVFRFLFITVPQFTLLVIVFTANADADPGRISIEPTSTASFVVKSCLLMLTVFAMSVAFLLYPFARCMTKTGLWNYCERNIDRKLQSMAFEYK